jgi:hypothetical protein
LLDDIITEMEKGAPSTVKLLVIQGFGDEVLIEHKICLESAEHHKGNVRSFWLRQLEASLHFIFNLQQVT